MNKKNERIWHMHLHMSFFFCNFVEEKHDEIVIYQSEDGQVKVDVLFENETVWLTIDQMCLLFGKAKSTISEHIKHIFAEGELQQDSVVRNDRTRLWCCDLDFCHSCKGNCRHQRRSYRRCNGFFRYHCNKQRQDCILHCHRYRIIKLRGAA